MVSARGVLRHEGFRYALDNGAWTAHQMGEQFDATAFCRAVDALGEGSDFIVVPDIVGGGIKSLEFSMSWLGRLRGIAPLLLAVQDGMAASDVRHLVGPKLGIFVGGTTPWKLSTMQCWGALARATGSYLHVGRVNSARRIALCASSGADSFDGSNATRFSCNLPSLDNARRQIPLPMHCEHRERGMM